MIKKLKSCFSKEEINTGRQKEMDIAKGFAIAFMIFAHSFETFSDRSNKVVEILGDNILGGPFSAPVFMFCMGVGICYSRKNTAKDLAKRGLEIFFVGWILNFFRYILPDFIGYFLMKDIGYLGVMKEFWRVDILQFAGLAFLVIAIMKKCKFSALIMCVTAVAMSVIGSILNGVSTGIEGMDIVTGFFWGSNEGSYFPLFNWIVFPIAGYLFGMQWRKCIDKNKFYRTVFPVISMVTFLYLIMTVTLGFVYTSGGEYFHLSLVDAIYFIILTIGILAFDYWMILKCSKIKWELFTRMSKNINTIYCIHWTIILLSKVFYKYFTGRDFIANWQIFILTFALIIISDYLAIWYGRSKEWILKSKVIEL